MNSEYLIFNLIILSGPLVLSFDKKVNFVKYWKFALPAILIPLVPYIIWDALVTDRHWWFNENYTLPFRLLKLPLGEWLFFITVPYACLFTWQCIGDYFPKTTTVKFRNYFLLAFFIFGLGMGIFSTGKEYTGLAIAAFAIAIMIDCLLKTGVFSQKRTAWFLGLCGIFVLIFNGYLTARPVVLYDPQYQLDFRITTIPIEDFVYGFSLLLLNVSLFEYFKKRNQEKMQTAESTVVANG